MRGSNTFATDSTINKSSLNYINGKPTAVLSRKHRFLIPDSGYFPRINIAFTSHNSTKVPGPLGVLLHTYTF